MSKGPAAWVHIAGDRDRASPSLVGLTPAFTRRLRARADSGAGPPADKAFVDGLYEDGEGPAAERPLSASRAR